MRDLADAQANLPVGWKYAALGDVTTIINGGTPKSKVALYWDGDVQWLTPKDMGKMSGREIAATPRTISDEGLAKSSARLAPPQSVILSTRAPIGHLAINTTAMAFNQGCRGLVAGEMLDHLFLFYFLGANRELLNDLGSGTTFKELSATNLKSVKIPLPPLEEQKRIVAVLDQAFTALDRARANAEANLADAGELFTPISADLLKQHSPPSAWTRTTLEDVAELRGGYAFKSQQYTEDGEFVLRTVNISEDGFIARGKDKYISEEDAKGFSKFRLRIGDTLFVMVGATLGKIGHVSRDDLPALLNQNMWVIRPLDQRIEPQFLTELYRETTKKVVENSRGAARSFVKRDDVRRLPVCFPDYEEQLTILEKLEETKSNFDRLRRYYQQTLTDLADLRQSLLQRAFTGQL